MKRWNIENRSFVWHFSGQYVIKSPFYNQKVTKSIIFVESKQISFLL